MIPEYPKIKPIELDDRSFLLKALDGAPKSICEFAAANLFIWADFDRPEATLINNNLCILINPINEAPYFLEPIGTSKIRETAETCLSHAGRISRTTSLLADILKGKQCHITPMRNQFDYVYLTSELAELKGKKFDGKRNHIKKFQVHNPDYEFLPLSPELKDQALELFEKWFEIRKESRFFPRLAYKYQKTALEKAFSLYRELGLIGGAIISEKKMKGFIIGSRLNKDTACAHFSYGDPLSQGISPILLWESAKGVFGEFKYMNLEQDLGIPGLRTAKLSYNPYRLEEKFNIECRV